MRYSLLFCLLLAGLPLSAQAVDEDQLGAWYMYFYNARFGNGPFGIQGDFQFRYWNFGTDLEQILIRNGLTYRPKDADVLFTLGYATITSGVPGESSESSHENRIYQEALLPHKVGGRFLLTHRFRYEQRWVEGQDFRTRYRYNLFLNVPLNARELGHKTAYLALYNELFINGQQDVGNGNRVATFDRNRTYLGLGYGLGRKLRVQLGAMNQTTATWSKWQTQFSAHHTF
ncbi:DUF2490 domain-containing protein [Neolewinella lacunae]|uniref:DUF2490 domain-containing protein n=1 Tax=Neolewinella lacunae TaxID=1517758 RepID=A0A923T6M2_9BACT|nr:DUF2490 domain-containing protein [Neolewinella lacunae]MBC6992741.1 DUF2490 domain-containing protein [Neolewinella lacunae]MDN3635985.1 DUF2490 domain-containing protein [Neolewinella lacunae]